jgi:tRNA nucleotidyltransferase (CCA-adding enzyme)
VGQVPVVEEGAVIGIVTRTDLVRLLLGPTSPTDSDEIALKLDQRIPAPRRELILKARDAANALGYSLYIVGGFVRDLLLGIPDLDVDLVVEGDAIKVAQRLADELGAEMRSHRRFGTAKVLLNPVAHPEWPPALDLATTRIEFYERERPSLPRVERSTIKGDLKRRDFTVNTLAICLDRARYGELLDPYGGVRDLEEGWLRVLHNFSFIEDPTRILRAVRLEQRLGFSIEPQTLELIESDVERLRGVTGPRIRNELGLIFEEAMPEKSWRRLDELGALANVHPCLRYAPWIGAKMAEMREQWEVLHGPEADQHPPFSTDAIADEPNGQGRVPPILYWCLATCDLSVEDLAEVADRLRILKRDERIMEQANRLRRAMPELARANPAPSAIHRLLQGCEEAALLAAYVAADEPAARAHIACYQRELRWIKIEVDGAYLRSLGLSPGPRFGLILDQVHDALLDGQVVSREEQEMLAAELVRRAL